MATQAERAEEAERPGRGLGWRLWALVPVVLLALVVAAYVASGSSLVNLIGANAPQADEFDIRRVEFRPGEIKVRVTNPQQDDLTIASVTVDDAIVPFELDGPETLGRLRSSTVVIPYRWVPDDPMLIGVTSSTGIETVEEIPAAVETPGLDGGSVLGYGLIGFLVGVLPVALGLLWLPSLRRAEQRWLTAFMALTGGLLSFLGVEALFEAFELQAAVPGAFGGPGLVLLGVAISYLTMTFISTRFSAAEGSGALGGIALATLVAIGIGLHNFGEGLAIGSSFAFGQLTLGSFLIVGFMIHNVTEGLGIAAPAADSGATLSLWRLGALALIAGAPAILGTWTGGFIANDVLAVLFFGAAAGAAFEVVVEVARYVSRRDPAGLRSAWAIGGFLAGIAVMYVTGLIAG
jgi:ZIP family zinc transporter